MTYYIAKNLYAFLVIGFVISNINSCKPSNGIIKTTSDNEKELHRKPVGDAPEQSSSEPFNMPSFPNKHVAPIFLEHGQHKVNVEGCLASKSKGDESGRSFPQKIQLKASQDHEILIKALPTGIHLTHSLTHACCLEVKLEGTIKDDNIKIREIFSGEPCRCLCSSKIDFYLGARKGLYNVEVLSNQKGEEMIVYSTKIDVAGPVQIPHPQH